MSLAGTAPEKVSIFWPLYRTMKVGMLLTPLQMSKTK